MKNKFIKDLQFKDYQKLDAINASLLKKIALSPAHLAAERDTERKDEKPLILGRAIHSAVLEPEKFKTDYIVADCQMRTAKGYKDLVIENPEKEIITRTENQMIQGICESLSRHKQARTLLEIESHNELSGVWTDPEAGILCKGRVDRYVNDENGKPLIIDLKSTMDASYESFRKSIYNYGYHISAAYYLNGFTQVTGIEHTRFIIIACEKEAPYEIAVYELAADAIELGEAKRIQYLRKYKECMESGQWQGYPDVVQAISLPNYAWAV